MRQSLRVSNKALCGARSGSSSGCSLILSLSLFGELGDHVGDRIDPWLASTRRTCAWACLDSDASAHMPRRSPTALSFFLCLVPCLFSRSRKHSKYDAEPCLGIGRLLSAEVL